MMVKSEQTSCHCAELLVHKLATQHTKQQASQMSDIDEGSSSDSDSSVASSVSNQCSQTPAISEDIVSQTHIQSIAKDSAPVGLVPEFSTPTASSKKKVVRRTNLQIQADNAAKSSEKVVKISKVSKKQKSKLDTLVQSEDTAKITDKVDPISKACTTQEKDSRIETSVTVTHVTVGSDRFPLQAAKTVWTTAETLDLIKVRWNSPPSSRDTA